MQPRPPFYDTYNGQATQADEIELGVDRSPRDPANEDITDSRWDDDQEPSSRQGPNQGPAGMSSASSGFPPTNFEEGTISAAEAAKSRSFRALRTAKACDICKIRKVKCDGGDPCAPCRLHSSICIYSKTTRKKLLSLSETNARNGQAIIHKNPRGRPMTTDIGSWAYKDRMSDNTPVNPAEPGLQNLNIDSNTTKRRRTSSELGEMDISFQTSGVPFDSRPRGSTFDTQSAFGRSYPEIMKDGGPYAVSDTRSSRVAVDFANNPMQVPVGLDGAGGISSRRPLSMSFQEFPGTLVVPELLESTPPTSSRTKDTPSSMQTASNMLAATTRSTPASGSMPSGQPGNSFEQSLDNDSRAMYNDLRDPVFEDDFQGVKSPQYPHKNSSVYSGFSYDTPADPEYGVRPRVRSQRASSSIIGAEADALGNAGITTFQPGSGAKGLLWWGPTSFLSLQDRLVQVLKAQASSGLEIDPSLNSKSNRGSGNDGSSRSQSPGKGYTVWRWGCDKLIFRFKPPIDETAIPIDPLFLPSQLAHRFFHAYTVIVHPLYPVVNLDQVRSSISDAYAGFVGYRPNPADRPSEHTRSMHKARDLMVLALGAQIEGGDGDAHCPKEVARAWSKHLADQAHSILANSRENGVVDAIRIWLLYTVYLGNYGQIDEQYVAVGHAARLTASLGLHREPTCQLRDSKDEGLRELFWTTYILEKTVSLWQGRPSCLNMQSEIDTALPQAGDLIFSKIKINALRSMVDLVDSVESVHAIYLNQNRDVSKASAFNKVNKVFRELEIMRRSVSAELRNFESVDTDAPDTLVALDTPEGEKALFRFRLCLLYHNLRMLASLPLLSFLVWQDITKQRASIDQQVLSDLAEECVSSAETTILAFNVYMARIPYLPFMGDFTTMLLYAIPIIYLDSLRYDRKSIARRNIEALRLAMGVLQHFDHPAGEVCKAMVQDLFDNYMQRPEWSNPSMQLQSSSMNNPAGSSELLSWLTSPYDHARQRPNPPQ